MEANTRQLHLTFEKGLTNVPSDIVCDDNSLEVAEGMIYKDGEHQVVQKPVEIVNNLPAGNLLHVHHIEEDDIYLLGQGQTLKWGRITEREGYAQIGQMFFTDGNVLSVKSMGTYLLVNTEAGIKILKWKDNTYIAFGNVPEPEVYIKMFGGDDYINDHDINYDQLIDLPQKDQNNAVIGAYDAHKNKLHSEGKFANPFFARYALELYDGSFAYISNPILFVPSLNTNMRLNEGIGDLVSTTLSYGKLCVKVLNVNDYQNLRDIIRGIAFFVSKEVELIDRKKDVDMGITAPGQSYPLRGIWSTGAVSGQTDLENAPMMLYSYDSPAGHRPFRNGARSAEDINKELEGFSVFYKVKSYDIDEIPQTFEERNIFDTDLTALTTLTQLGEDDYFSRSQFVSKYLDVFNGRLSLFDFKRSLFNGFDDFMPYHIENYAPRRIFVDIETGDGMKTVMKYTEKNTSTGYYFYYPDRRAKHVHVEKLVNGVWKTIFDQPLKEHKGLNGAYYFCGIKDDFLPDTMDGPSTRQEITGTQYEQLYGTIVTSEVNNPFVFPAKGYTKVCDGNVIGLSGITQAVSQGQFGRRMIAFTDKGIFVLEISSEGWFTNVDPFDREVCEWPNQIVQVDKAIFFVNKKGLMAVGGSQLESKNVSVAFRSKEFIDFVNDREIRLAYDYRDSLLWFLKSGSAECYVYSIETGTFSTYRFTVTPTLLNVVNNYPDTLVQMDTKVLSMIKRPLPEDDNTKYLAHLKSRPIKFGDGMVLKSLRQVRHIKNIQQGTLGFRLWVSNDLVHWQELHSLHGKPWKYFKFEYLFNNLIATDRFAGTAIVVQDRRQNRLQ